MTQLVVCAWKESVLPSRISVPWISRAWFSTPNIRQDSHPALAILSEDPSTWINFLKQRLPCNLIWMKYPNGAEATRVAVRKQEGSGRSKDSYTICTYLSVCTAKFTRELQNRTWSRNQVHKLNCQGLWTKSGNLKPITRIGCFFQRLLEWEHNSSSELILDCNKCFCLELSITEAYLCSGDAFGGAPEAHKVS